MKAETTNNKLQEYKQKDNIGRSEVEPCSLLWLKFNIIILGTLKHAYRTFILSIVAIIKTFMPRLQT